jgi:hypothetical protein
MCNDWCVMSEEHVHDSFCGHWFWHEEWHEIPHPDDCCLGSD